MSATSTRPETGTRFRGHALVPAVLALTVLANSAMVPLMPYLLATRLDWPLWLVGLYSFAIMATTILLNRKASTLVDKGTSTVKLCAAGGLAQVGAASTAVFAFQHPALLVLVVPLLAAGGATVPVFYAMGRRSAEAAEVNLPKYNSALRVATSGGWVIGPAASFALIGSFSDATAFLSIAGTALLALIALIALRHQLEGARATTHQQGDSNGVVSGEIDAGVRRQVRAAVTIVFLLSFAHIATTTSLPLLLVEHTGIPESGTGIILAVKALVEMCAILAAPSILQRLGTRWTLISCSILAFTAYTLYFFSDRWVLVLLGSVLEGGYYGLFAAVGLTWVQSLCPGRIGWVTGSYMTGIYTGVLLAAPASGLIATFWLQGITTLSILAALTAILLTLRFTRLSISREPTAR